MLSILIPIYNWDCRQLIHKILEQCRTEYIEFEILCFDDGSDEIFKIKNCEIRTLLNVSYIEFKKNLGRSAIRNRLASHARFENLLFLDCDSSIVCDTFIKNYLKAMGTYKIVYGGTCYQKEQPDDSYVLRWKYGRLREDVPATKRQLRGNKHFMTNNFCIKKSLFDHFQFDASINGYGYEDSVFAFDLEKANYQVFHIENPVRHDGLDRSDEYLNKIKSSIRNLVRLRANHQVRNTKITDLYDKLQFFKLDRLVLSILKFFNTKMYVNLTSKNPSIRVLDMWKLMHYGSIYNEQKNIR